MKTLGTIAIILLIFIGACKKDNTTPSPENNVVQTFSVYGIWKIDSVKTANYINDSIGLSIIVVDSPYTLEFRTNGIAYYKKFGMTNTSNYFYNDSLNQLIIDGNNDNVLDSTTFYKTSKTKCYFVWNLNKTISGNDTIRTEERYYITK
jgi:hypothetical protein